MGEFRPSASQVDLEMKRLPPEAMKTKDDFKTICDHMVCPVCSVKAIQKGTHYDPFQQSFVTLFRCREPTCRMVEWYQVTGKLEEKKVR